MQPIGLQTIEEDIRLIAIMCFDGIITFKLLISLTLITIVQILQKIYDALFFLGLIPLWDQTWPLMWRGLISVIR